MKINHETRFPHPVLSPDTHDFNSGEFLVDFEIDEAERSGSLVLRYTVSMTEPTLAERIQNEELCAGVYVVCPSTYFNQLRRFEGTGGSLTFAAGELKGRVLLRPLVWADRDIEEFDSAAIHPEFGGAAWDFGFGTILALGNEYSLNVGMEKLAPMATIFTLSRNDGLNDGESVIDLDGDEIVIGVNEKTHKKIHNMRLGSREGQAALLNAIYLPAVMEVLANLREEGGGWEGRRWHRVFVAKCEAMSINPANGELLKSAQKLLKSPFKKIMEVM